MVSRAVAGNGKSAGASIPKGPTSVWRTRHRFFQFPVFPDHPVSVGGEPVEKGAGTATSCACRQVNLPPVAEPVPFFSSLYSTFIPRFYSTAATCEQRDCRRFVASLYIFPDTLLRVGLTSWKALLPYDI